MIAHKAPLAALGDFLAKRRKRSRGLTIGLESDHFHHLQRKRFGQVTMPSGIRLKDAPPIVERFRMVKDPREIALIKDAVALGAKIFDRGLEVLRAGAREVEVAAEMELAARRAGAEEMSLPTIIAAGARSALPHGRCFHPPIPSGAWTTASCPVCGKEIDLASDIQMAAKVSSRLALQPPDETSTNPWWKRAGKTEDGVPSQYGIVSNGAQFAFQGHYVDDVQLTTVAECAAQLGQLSTVSEVCIMITDPVFVVVKFPRPGPVAFRTSLPGSSAEELVNALRPVEVKPKSMSKFPQAHCYSERRARKSPTSCQTIR